MRLTLTLTKWLAPAAALLILAGALLAPVEAGSAFRRTQNVNTVSLSSTPEPADSIVRGHAVYDDTSRPVRRARVMLITEESDGRREYAALTDGRGDFEIRNVRAGTYYAFIDVPGVLSPVGFISVEELRASGGMPSLGEGRKYFDRVEVDGHADLNVTVHARRGASLAGRVSYADGDPAVNVSVTLMRRSADGRVQKYLTGATIVSLSGLRTDDRGMFRLTGLPPGEYLIGISETVNHGTPGTDTGSVGEDLPGAFRGMFTQPLLMTFYPSATTLKEAGSVKVEAGDERADVDIIIPERDLRTVSGLVRSRRGGVPVRGARVTISRRDDQLVSADMRNYYYDPSESAANVTMTDTEGRWQFREIPDGPYTIAVAPPEEYEEAPPVAAVANMNSNVEVTTATNMNTAAAYRPPRRKRSYAPARRDFEVSGGDVSELVVEVADGARITGVVAIEGAGEPRYGYVSAMHLGEASAGESDMSAGHASLDGGRFAVEGLQSGRYFLRANVGGGSSTYLKSITWNGKDLLREPLVLTEGAEVSGVRIVFASNPGTLSVSVRAAHGRPAANVLIALVPPDPSAGWLDSRSTFCVTRDANGCSITAPPGEYRVVALRRTAMRDDSEQEVMRRAATAPRVTLREGETARVELDAPDN